MSAQAISVESEPTGLAAISVAAAMRPGVVTCAPGAPLRDVARAMARFRIHAVVVFSVSDEDEFAGIWGVVSDSDLIAAAAAGKIEGRTAGGAARTPLVTIGRKANLARAVELMHDRHATHLVVVSPNTARPVGILSSLDIARAIALEAP